MQFKRTFYLICATILGVMLSYVVHAVVEILYLNSAVAAGRHITWYMHSGIGACALPPVVQYGLLALGIIGGYFLGRWWWRKVYIEKRHWRFHRKP